MIIGKVVNKIVSTRKHDQLNGFKLLVIEPCFGQQQASFVAADELGAGEGEIVMVTTGSAAQHGIRTTAPIDAVVVGIVDDPAAISIAY